MKIIITGATGLVGKAVIRECIANNSITHAFVLSRKSLPDEITKNSKITVVLHDNFSIYPQELMQQLAGCEACIWAIGGRAPQFPDLKTYREVQVDYTIAAAHAFRQHLAPMLPANKRFRFVFCSGKYAEWDQTKSLSFMADTRHAKGEVEKKLCEIAAKKDHRMDVWCARPSGILPSDVGFFGKLSGSLYSAIKVQDLATALARIALNGYQKQIIESNDLAQI